MFGQKRVQRVRFQVNSHEKIIINIGIEGREGAKSLMRGDCLYIYGGYSKHVKTKVNYMELFELNLSKRMKEELK